MFSLPMIPSSSVRLLRKRIDKSRLCFRDIATYQGRLLMRRN
ncbi:hypothetical protein LINPERHAP1_LOCUS22220 [Linum perenne]